MNVNGLTKPLEQEEIHMRHPYEEDLQLLITLDDLEDAQEEDTFNHLQAENTVDVFHAEIEKLAYQFWEERGRPLGSSEEDWFRAERQLQHYFNNERLFAYI
jgi:hypothetical protein